MGYTFAEKIIAKKAGQTVCAGDTVVVCVDRMMASDTTAPIAIRAFHEMGGVMLAKPKDTILVVDHATPCPNEHIAALHRLMRDFAREQGCLLFDQNYGVCHQVMLENNLVGEGDLVLGADSHTCSYGAVGAFAVGVGSTDLGAAMLTGKIWLRVPDTMRIELHGVLPKGVFAKDVILRIIGDLTCDGATYEAVEFAGDGFAGFSREEAITVCNMTIEMGGKSGVFVSALHNPEWVPDPDAVYSRVIHYNARDFVPVVSRPHTVDNVAPVSACAGQRVDVVYIGSCTNGRIEDFAAAASILRGKRVARDVRLMICPASNQVLKQMVEQGCLAELIDAGATLVTPGCGLCVGTLGGVPGDGEVIVSTTNRNFKGRMGNNKSFIYLASSATAAACALTGSITDPREVLGT